MSAELPNFDLIAKIISRWYLDPLAYVEQCIGQDGSTPDRTIDPHQREALIRLRSEPRLAIRSGHGVGKTTLDAWIIHWFGDTRTDAKIPITAPVSSQLEIQLWGELRKWKMQKAAYSPIGAWLADQMNIKTDEVEWANGNLAVARTARPDKPEAIAGFHAKHLLFLMDEASGIPELVFETALGSLSTPGAIQVMTGNPTRAQGYFFNAFHRNRENWSVMRVSSEDVPRARGHIKDIIETYGKDSNQYRVRVLGEFPLNSDDQLISISAIEACIARWGKIAPIKVRPIWGGDVGYRVDRSTLAKRRGNAMMEPPKFWSGLDPMQYCGVIKQEWDNTLLHDRPSAICIDVIGLGAGVVARLREMGLPVIGVNVGENARDPLKYHRLRDELWWLSREWFNAIDSIVPNIDNNVMRQLISELSAPLLLPPTSNGRIQIEKKDVTKTRLHVSPDLADGWNLTFAAYPVPIGQTSAFQTGMAKIEFDPTA